MAPRETDRPTAARRWGRAGAARSRPAAGVRSVCGAARAGRPGPRPGVEELDPESAPRGPGRGRQRGAALDHVLDRRPGGIGQADDPHLLAVHAPAQAQESRPSPPPRLARVRGRAPGRFPRRRRGPSTSRPAPGPRPGPSGTAGEVLELHRRQRQVTPDRRPREPHRVRPCPQDVAAAGEDGPPPLQPAARRPTADLGQNRLTDPIGHVHDLPVHPRHHRDGRSALVLDHSNGNGPPIGTGGTGRGGRTSADVGRLRPEADASQSLPA
jgi:hypothetical protein